MTAKKVAFGNLKTGDTIICPSDGRKERVTFARRNRDGSVHVRTTRHDHFRHEHTHAEVVGQ